MSSSSKSIILMPCLFALAGLSPLAAHPSQGLWVGEVALNAVNEATGAVGDSNTYEFSDPEIPTPTSDTAYLRLILHVNGAGQVSLLKSVAIAERESFADGSKNILLVTDPILYPQVSGIPKRIATAFYDFGDQKAVTAVQSLIDNATQSAVAQVIANGGDAPAAIETAVLAALQAVVTGANVNSSFLNRGTGATSFMTTDFFSEADVHTIAEQVASLIHGGAKVASDFAFAATDDSYNPFPADPLGGNFLATVEKARMLRDNSFYRDTRGLEAIAGVVTAAAAAAETQGESADLNIRQAAARSAATDARHNAADSTQAFNRFLAGAEFNAMRTAIPAVALTIALASEAGGLNESQIATEVKNTLLLEEPVGAALTEAVVIRAASLFGDTRAEAAVELVLNRVSAAAAAQVTISIDETGLADAIGTALSEAFDAVNSAPVFAFAPSSEYTGFVTGSTYQQAAENAARTAAAEAVFQFNAGVTRPAELEFFTNRAVNRALFAPRNAAASLPQNSIPLGGRLVAGGLLDGTIHLPALAPTNPFMHRRHPDHTEGFPITRRIALAVDDAGLGTPGYGVSRISGTYFEEIFGLHKPLGANQNVGLRTQGTFTLNRLTLVDTLNF